MLRKLVALILLFVACFLLYASASSEVFITIPYDEIRSRTANPTEDLIITGSLNPMIGETYTYQLINADKAKNISVIMYPADDIGTGYSYSPSDQIPLTPLQNNTLRITFSQERPYLLKASYVQNGTSKKADLVIKPVNRSAVLGQKVMQIASQCRSSGATTDYEIALWLHDYLINHAYYDLTYTEYGPDGVLLKGYGVCDSYSRAYQMLLNEFGIPNYRQDGLGLKASHAWNVVQLGGKWYQIDPTWDDPSGETVAVSGSERYTYFAVTDEILGRDHTYTIAQPCNSMDENYYTHQGIPDIYHYFPDNQWVKRDEELVYYLTYGLPDIYAYEVDKTITRLAADGADTITCDVSGGYCTKTETDENGTLWIYSSQRLADEVFTQMAKDKSDQAWTGPEDSTVFYDFTYDADKKQLIGSKAILPDPNSYTCDMQWYSWPVYKGQDAIVYFKLNQPVNRHQTLMCVFNDSDDKWYGFNLDDQYQYFRITGTDVDLMELYLVIDDHFISHLCAAPLNGGSRLWIPDNTKHIEDNAFEGIAAEYIRLPDGCKSIGHQAFANNKNLRNVLLPASVTTIAVDAFQGCDLDHLYITVETGSPADQALQGTYNLLKDNSSVLHKRSQ